MIELGDRVEISYDDFETIEAEGIVIFEDSHDYHIRRDDGILGGGFDNSWLTLKFCVRLVSSKFTTTSTFFD